MATGKVIQITGPVVDVEFPPGELPALYNAVEVRRTPQAMEAVTGGGDGVSGGARGDGGGRGEPARDETLVLEVQQHLGNNWVRAVAMSTTDGLARGLDVVDTGAPITVPVVMDLLSSRRGLPPRRRSRSSRG